MSHIHTPLMLHIELGRSHKPGPAIPVYRPGMGYCETCRSYQPRPGKANKGWKCNTCKNNGENP